MEKIKFNDVEVYFNNESSISLGEKTLMFFDDNIPLSPEKIGQLSARDNAIYGASLSCGANCFALEIKCENSSAGINDIESIKKLYESLNSCSDILVSLSAFDLCFLTSSSRNSGATNLNLLRIALNKKTEWVIPLFISEDITTLASTTNLSDIFYNLSYLCDNDVLISSDNSSAWNCVNSDFETACLNLTVLESLSFSKLLINIDISMLANALNSDSSSLGILTFSSTIKKDNRENYLNVSNKLVINSLRTAVASIDDKGDMYLLGTKSESQGSLTPTQNSFIVKDSSGSAIAYINSTGSLFLKGTASTGLTGLTTANLEFRNSDGGLIAFFDNTGNLKLNGTLYENYASP